MPERKAEYWISMLRSFVEQGNRMNYIIVYVHNIKFLAEQCRTEHDNVIFSITLKASSELRDFNEGRKLHSLIFKVGSIDSFVSMGLIDIYAKCGTAEFARDVFNEVSEKDVLRNVNMGRVVHSLAIQFGLVEDALVKKVGQFAEHGFHNDSLELFGKMNVVGLEQWRHMLAWLEGYMTTFKFSDAMAVQKTMLQIEMGGVATMLHSISMGRLQLAEAMNANFPAAVLWTQ
ncbi:pentatricopeptide repeat-containing protein At2g03380, mitochondrial-like [Aristolochia californica]|uniref:pentatricopeptide repeat-containing protein At2g03380, mitochondrial-like n=1 Tax=Aristolochia californica TaxID=171875 RepID=UPI0035D80410